MSVFILENLSKTFWEYKKENKVLKNINIIFPDNGLVSIVGKSGSGKSTLLNILMGIEKPTEGKVYFNKKDISKFKDKQFSNYHLDGVSLIFQSYNLFEDLTALENAILPLQMKGIKTSKAKEQALVYFNKFGIAELANRKINNLSGGEKQRIAIIRSILVKPKAILCDEPTGALDYKNSEEIMGILKEISTKTLVIMVSHNKRLVNRYSDQILTLKDGEIVKNISNIKNTFTAQYTKKKVSYKKKWGNKFLRLNLRKNIFRNIFSIVSCSIAFASMFLSVGFSCGSKESQDDALRKTLSIGFATASEVETIEIEGSPLLYEKTKRPDVDKIDNVFNEFSTVRYEENISYFINSYPKFKFDEKSYDNFQMLPVYDMTLATYGEDLIKEGQKSSGIFEEIYVNEEFEKMVGKSLLNETITIENSAPVNYPTGIKENPFIRDTFTLTQKMKIVGILHEFPFLNTPKLYFSYNGAKQYLKSSYMENLSYYFGKTYSFYDYLVECSSDDPASSYSSYIFLEDLSELDDFTKTIEGDVKSNIKIDFSAIQIKDTYSTFINSFSTTLYLFVIIAFAGINFILGMISLSTFISNKKNTAILTCLGARNSSIFNLYLTENFLVVLLAFVSSGFLALLLQNVLNPIIYSKFVLNNLIKIPFKNFLGIPFGLVLILFSVASVFSAIFTLTPMLFYRHKSLADELRDEWW